jgi:hypothetical protein
MTWYAATAIACAMNATGDHGHATGAVIDAEAAAIAREQTEAVPAELLLAVAYQESRFNPRDVSPQGDLGVFQINSPHASRARREELFDIDYNTHLAALMLEHVRVRMQREMAGDTLILAGGWVAGWLLGNPPDDLSGIPASERTTARIAHRRRLWAAYAWTVMRFRLTFRDRLERCASTVAPAP